MQATDPSQGFTVKIIELWRWYHSAPDTGKRTQTRYLLTEEHARAQLIEPERVEGSRELRRVPDGPHEWHMTGGFRNKPD